MTRILIIKTGDTAHEVQADHGDYDRWFIDAMPQAGLTFEVRDVTRDGGPRLDGFGGFDGVIVTGSVSSAYRSEPWMPALSDLLRRPERHAPPILCVCFGAQLLAQARGGRVALNPEGWEIGAVDVELTEAARHDPLFEGLPRTLTVLATHEDRIEAPPPGAVLLAGNAHTPVQGFLAARNLWGVQFHPEATPAIIRRLIELRSDGLARDARYHGAASEGHIERLVGSLERPEALQGRRLLDNFVRICQGERR